MSLDFAINKVNGEGGVKGRQIQVIKEDSKSENKEAVNAINKLFNIDKVNFIITVT